MSLSLIKSISAVSVFADCMWLARRKMGFSQWIWNSNDVKSWRYHLKSRMELFVVRYFMQNKHDWLWSLWQYDYFRCVCVCVHVCECVCVCMCLWECLCASEYLSACLYVCVCVYTCKIKKERKSKSEGKRV